MEFIEERVSDALILWRANRGEGALLLALVAVVARARQDFPKPTGEAECFRRYVESKMPQRISVEYRGEQWPIERLFYTWIRCEIVHAGGLPIDLGFADNAEPGELMIRAGGAPEYRVLVSPGWFEQLVAWARA